MGLLGGVLVGLGFWNMLVWLGINKKVPPHPNGNIFLNQQTPDKENRSIFLNVPEKNNTQWKLDTRKNKILNIPE